MLQLPTTTTPPPAAAAAATTAATTHRELPGPMCGVTIGSILQHLQLEATMTFCRMHGLFKMGIMTNMSFGKVRCRGSRHACPIKAS